MRIGVFGGTFDPPHLGHLIVASAAFETLRLERILFVPAAVPPHKLGMVIATAEQRLEMVKVSVAGDTRFEVDELELHRPGSSFTVDTLRTLRERHRGSELFFLLGADQLRELHTWRDPDEVSTLATLAVLSRGGDQLPEAGRYRFLPVAVPRIDIAATEIRRKVQAGESIRYLVTERVREMIQDWGLYRKAKGR
ncbi:nicotinate-nucleotide adenylyltransferase [soil metagenome]